MQLAGSISRPLWGRGDQGREGQETQHGELRVTDTFRA